MSSLLAGHSRYWDHSLLPNVESLIDDDDDDDGSIYTMTTTAMKT